MNKKLLILPAIILFAFGTAKAQTGAYSPVHVQHLKNCSPYTQEYVTRIPTGDPNSPYLNLKSKETISGWLNGKCITKSRVFSGDLNKEIFVSRCALNKKQLSSLIHKMTVINKSDDEGVRESLSQELSSMMKNPEICKFENYLEEE